MVRVLNRVEQPKFLFCDNGSEFTSQAMDLWAYQNGMKIDFSRPGKPTDNAFVESFNGTFRAECLNDHCFGSLPEAKRLIEANAPVRLSINRAPVRTGKSTSLRAIRLLNLYRARDDRWRPRESRIRKAVTAEDPPRPL